MTLEPSIVRRRAIRCAAWSAATLGCGVIYLFAVVTWDLTALPLLGFAAVQLAFGASAVVLGFRARRGGGRAPVGAIVVGILLGMLGAIGVPLWLAVDAALNTGFGGFGAWGRPLRIRGRAVHVQVSAGDDWTAGASPEVAALSSEARAALAAWWLRDAQKEHASVPAFARLAWQLAALGAPAALLERAYAAGLEEIDHARRCFALVAAYRGEPCGVLAMPELAGDRAAITLEALAAESLVDGCFIEDLNSDAAELALARATDPAVRALLATIVRDERSHARLAWDLVAWCLRAGGEPVARALRRAAAAIAPEGGGLYDAELAALVAACDVADLHAHGRVPLADWPALYATRLVATRERLGELLHGVASWAISAPDSARV